MTFTTKRSRRLILAAGACAVIACGGGGSGDEEPSPPAAPTGLTATAAGHSRVDLAWTDRSGDETGFKIERSSTSATAGFAALHTVASGETLWGDTTVSPSTRYWYRVCATSGAGDSAWSNVADATTEPSPVGAPTDLVAEATSPNAVALTWVDHSSNEDGFELQRSATSAAAGFVQIGLELADSTSAGDGSVLPGTTYWYRVRAYNSDGTSGWSNVATVTTPTGLPGAPTGVAAVATSPTTADVSWTAPAVGNPTSYTVEYRTGGGPWVPGCNASATFCTVGGLQQSTPYEFHVIAYNGFGNGPASAIASATTPSGLPGAPTGVAAVATSPTTVDVSWTAPAVGSPSLYVVEYRTGGGPWTFGYNAYGTTSCTVGGLQQSTPYEFHVIAYNGFGNGPASAIASATTPSGLPGAPTGVAAVATSPMSVDVSWTEPSGNPSGYLVEYRTGGGPWTFGYNAYGTTSCTVGGLQQSTPYEFHVIAYNGFGNGPASAIASATTPSGLPGAPTGLVAVATSSTSVDLSWSEPSGSPSGYVVEYRIGAGPWAFWSSFTATSVRIEPLAPDTAYGFRVAAYNAFGQGPPSELASATTPP